MLRKYHDRESRSSKPVGVVQSVEKRVEGESKKSAESSIDLPGEGVEPAPMRLSNSEVLGNLDLILQYLSPSQRNQVKSLL